MELIADRELGIAGERYGSFLEAYRVNDRRPLNAQVAARGDGLSQGLVEADDGIVFTPQETRKALLYGSDLYSGRYKEMRKRVRKTLAERYEWMEEDRFGADVRGAHVIMERYAIGHPEAFHRRRRTLRRERSVEILYDAMCPASTPVAKRIEAGCIVAACADALERIGYRVALTFCLATYDGNSMSDDPTLLLEVALKGYGDALNVKRLEFPLAAKPVLFHLGVWWAHRFPGAPADFGAGEGYPVSYDARRVRAMEEHARLRHGAYLSEDILEMQLGMDPTRALERILGAVGEADVLEQHMVQKTTMQASESPSQGKLFGGVREPEAAPDARRAPGAGGTERSGETRERPDATGAGEARAGGGEDAGAAPDAGAGGAGGEVPDAGGGGEVPGTAPDAGGSPSSPGDGGLRAHGPAGRQGDGGDPRSGAADGQAPDDGQQATDRAPQPGDAGADGGAGAGGQVPGGSQDGGDVEDSADAASEAGDAGDDAAGGGESAGGDDGDPSGTDDGAATAGSGSGASAPSGAGSADSPGGGGTGEERPSGGDEPEDDEDEDEQGEAMSDDTGEEQQEQDSEDAKRNEEEPPEDRRSERDADEEEQERDSFIVELRKRYVRFEQGDYRRMKEREEREAKARAGVSGSGGSTGRGPVKAPPARPVTGADDYEFGTPRSTPFSMNYVPKRKG